MSLAGAGESRPTWGEEPEAPPPSPLPQRHLRVREPPPPPRGTGFYAAGGKFLLQPPVRGAPRGKGGVSEGRARPRSSGASAGEAGGQNTSGPRSFSDAEPARPEDAAGTVAQRPRGRGAGVAGRGGGGGCPGWRLPGLRGVLPSVSPTSPTPKWRARPLRPAARLIRRPRRSARFLRRPPPCARLRPCARRASAQSRLGPAVSRAPRSASPAAREVGAARKVGAGAADWACSEARAGSGLE